jgi:hypothetical protein
VTAEGRTDLLFIADKGLTKGEQAECEDGGEGEECENQHGTFFPCS